MRTFQRLVSAVSLAGVLVATGGVSTAAAAPATITRSFVDGQSVAVELVETSGCIQTITAVVASTSRSQPQGKLQTGFGFVFVHQRNECLSEQLITAAGEIETQILQIEPNLSAAHLVTSVNLNNILNGATFPVQVDLTFRATGKHVAGITVSTQLEKGDDRLSAIFRFWGIQRSAEVVGTVSSGSVLFASSASTTVQAFIDTSQLADLIVVRS
jgi:hypothetical protein